MDLAGPGPGLDLGLAAWLELTAPGQGCTWAGLDLGLAAWLELTGPGTGLDLVLAGPGLDWV